MVNDKFKKWIGQMIPIILGALFAALFGAIFGFFLWGFQDDINDIEDRVKRLETIHMK